MDDSSSSTSIITEAIDAALNCKWELALKLNKQIIQIDPENVDALNRQAKACFELGKYNLAKKYYSETLKYDPYNPIALKNLKIIKAFKSSGFTPRLDGHANGSKRISPLLFLQEPGKTKVVSLLKVAEPQKLSQVFPGMSVELCIKNHKLHILDQSGGYLGVLPDDLSYQLIRLIKGGNKYEVFVKSVKVNGLAVLIRETFRSNRFKGQPSFLGAYSGPILADIINISSEDQVEETDEAEEVEP